MKLAGCFFLLCGRPLKNQGLCATMMMKNLYESRGITIKCVYHEQSYFLKSYDAYDIVRLCNAGMRLL